MYETKSALVWYAHVPYVSKFINENIWLLSTAEKTRRQSFAQVGDRNLFAAAHILARFAAAQYLGCNADSVVLEQRCKSCGGPHGKPSIRGYCEQAIVWSHTPGAILVGISDAPIGVDIESKNSDLVVDSNLITRTMSHEEISRFRQNCTKHETVVTTTDFNRLWTYKESLVKLGLLKIDSFHSVTTPPPKEIDVSETSGVHTIEVNQSEPLVVLDYTTGAVGSVVTDALVKVQNVSRLLDST